MIVSKLSAAILCHNNECRGALVSTFQLSLIFTVSHFWGGSKHNHEH